MASAFRRKAGTVADIQTARNAAAVDDILTRDWRNDATVPDPP